jgi:hypothetical protein
MHSHTMASLSYSKLYPARKASCRVRSASSVHHVLLKVVSEAGCVGLNSAATRLPMAAGKHTTRHASSGHAGPHADAPDVPHISSARSASGGAGPLGSARRSAARRSRPVPDARRGMCRPAHARAPVGAGLGHAAAPAVQVPRAQHPIRQPAAGLQTW